MKTNLAAAGALLLAALPACATQTLDLRIVADGETFVKRQLVEEGMQESWTGALDSESGASRRTIIFNGVLNKAPEGGGLRLEYQLEVQGAGATDAIQSQSAVRLRAGAPLVAARCGVFTVTLTVYGEAEPAARLSNYKLSARTGHGDCAQLVELGAQANLVSGIADGRRLSLNAVVAEAAKSGYKTQYQVELSGGEGKPLAAQKEAVLSPGKELTIVEARGEKVTLRLDAPKPAGPSRKGPA